MRFKLIAAVLLSLILILPGSHAGWFNGWPLSAKETILAFFFFTALISTDWKNQKNLQRIILASLTAILALQLLTYHFLPSGWSVCLHSDAVKKELASACEPSAENPSGQISFVYEKIDFNQNNFPLYFFNNITYNYFKPGQPDRDSLPFTLEAQTYLFPQKNESLKIKANENALIRINGQEYNYTDASSTEKEIKLIPYELNSVYLKYESALDQKNLLQVTIPENNSYLPQAAHTVNFWFFPYKIANFLLLSLLFFSLAYGFFLSFQNLEKKDKYLLVILAIFTFLFFPWARLEELKFNQSFFPFSAFLIFAALYFSFRKTLARKKITAFLFLLVFLNACILTTIHVQTEKVDIFSGGNDELTHEAFSRSTFTVFNFKEFLNAGETDSLFYFQPLHRYFLGFFHKVLGEAMWGPYLAQTVIFSLAFLFFSQTLRYLAGSLAPISLNLIYFLLLINRPTAALRFIQTPYQQAIAFPLMILGLAQLFLLIKSTENKWWKYFLLGLTWSAVFMIRTDWIPLFFGLIIFSFFQFYRPKFKFILKKSALALALGLIIFPFLIGLRNYSVAGKFVFLPTSGYVNLLPEIRTTLGQNIDFHESSTLKFVSGINAAFQGNYFNLASALGKNLYQNVIDTSTYRLSLWLAATFFSLLSLFLIAKKRLVPSSAKLLLLLLAFFLPFVLINSFFRPHNGLAMLGIYDFFIITILAVNIQNLFSLTPLAKSFYRLFVQRFLKLDFSSSQKLSSFLQSKNPSQASLVDRIKIGYRPYICPFEELLEYLPEKASVFDIGCGSGMFLSLVSAFRKPSALGGTEISQSLIDNARVILKNSSVPVFLEIFNGQVLPPEISRYNYIFLIDVLHHIPKNRQRNFLKNICDKMSIGSFLIVKDIDASRSILCLFNKFHDYFFSAEKAGNEISSEMLKKYLLEIGFKVEKTTKKRILLYPHFTLIGRKN